MLLQEIADVEGFIRSLKTGTKTQITANVNFLIINYLSQEKNLDLYSFMDKFATLLSVENQEKLVTEIKNLTSINPSQSTIHQINDLNFNDLSFVSDSLENNIPDVEILPELELDLNPPQDDISIQPNSLIEKMKSQAASLLNEIHEHEMDVLKPLLTEGFKYIRVEPTSKTINGLDHFEFEPKVYTALRLFYLEESVHDIYINHFSHLSVIDFIKTRLLPLEKNNFMIFVKRIDWPKDKKFKLKLGELLVSSNKLTNEQLNHAMDVQKKEEDYIKANDFLHNITNTKKDRKRFLGEILFDLNYISKEELDDILEIQSWYNNLFS